MPLQNSGLLISGPPGPSTTAAVLTRFQARKDSLLLVPTATMAEHLRHTLAREGVRDGVTLRPKSIRTLAAFLDEWSPMAAALPAWVELWMERALDRQRPARFRDVAEFPGIVRALAELFDKVSGSRLPEDVGRLFLEVERELAARGVAPRHGRLKAAAERITEALATGSGVLPAHVLWLGFFKLSAGELELVAAVTRSAEVTIALPEYSGSERSRETLLAAGFDEQRVPQPPDSARTVLFRAPSIEREVEEIARRILEHRSRGRQFREMAVVLRSRDPYGPLVETTLARFGIPARAYFTDPLASHPAIQFRSMLVRAALANWDREMLLRAVRMPASGLGGTAEGDHLDFALREQIPAMGWGPGSALNARERLEAGEWAERLRILREWTPELAVEDRTERGMESRGVFDDRVRAWRSLAAAELGWKEAIDTAVRAFDGSGRITLEAFWRMVHTTLEREALRVPDARREVVHVLDAYEARQWSLPIAFVCGLTERHFPQHHSEDPLVGDRALARAGLDTAADRDREEQFLFDLAASRATEETILSYPRFDDAGQETIPSFFLPAIVPQDVNARVRPAPSWSVTLPSAASIQTEALQARLAAQHQKLSATSIETYMQCPFQFFVKKTLRATERPRAPRDRFDVLLQGSILHAALAEWAQAPILGETALEDAFERLTEERHVPNTYRTEAVRLELLRHFRAFTRDTTVTLHGWTRRTEEPFEFPVHDGLSLRGKIDRIDIGPAKRALVIDYKYSAASRLSERIHTTVTGDAIQAGVYLLAAERALGLNPVGMLFCHAKNGVKWDGWHAGMRELGDIGENRTASSFGELVRDAEQTVLRVHGEVTAGRIVAAPKDEKKCAWCECHDMCRIETVARVRASGGEADA